MKNLIITGIILFSSHSFAASYDCQNLVGIGELQIFANYDEVIVGDIMTVRFLNNIEVLHEGEEVLVKDFMPALVLKGMPNELGNGIEIQVFSNRTEVYYDSRVYELNCTEKEE